MNSNLEEPVAETMRKLNDPGLLLVSTNKHGENNVMAIGWGLIGVFFGKHVFLVSIDPSCYTHKFIEETGEFTVNVPQEGMNEIVKYCGEVSGREHEKFSECKLSLLKSRVVRPPVIGQCKLHYECRVVHKIDVIPRLTPLRFFVRSIIAKVKGFLYLRGNYCSLYFGEILAVY
ncbi:MAG TPA: flavin reductase family protein [Acidobacteriota bacterium]|nr:flavin reductase family protein [Acidobacteriota bacterium]